MRHLIRLAAAAASVCVLVLLTASMSGQTPAQTAPASGGTERHLRNIRKLTSGGENAEAYFSKDGTRLIFQATRAGYPCDQIYTMRLDGSDQRRISTGTGRTTCGYFYPAGDQILYASTHEGGAACPPRPSFERGYVWPIYASYDIYRARPDGTGLTPLTRTPGYDAEATIAPDGLITFTSTRDGDMEIYTMKADGSDVRRLTNRVGPDGGPFFSFDGRRIVFRGRTLEPGK
jgi:Tol biopolymer transport system component